MELDDKVHLLLPSAARQLVAAAQGNPLKPALSGHLRTFALNISRAQCHESRKVADTDV